MTLYRREIALVRGVVGSVLRLRGRSSRWLVAFGVVGMAVGQEEIYSPETFGIERYEHIWEQSPFIVETQVVTQSDGLGAQYSLTGLASLAGTPIAFIYDRNTLGRFSVAQGTMSEAGMELVSIEIDPDPRQSKATIRVGSEQASIGYDPAALLQTASAEVPGQAPNVNPALANPPGIIQRATTPAPNVIPPAPPGQTQPPGAARTIKRRTINIPTN